MENYKHDELKHCEFFSKNFISNWKNLNFKKKFNQSNLNQKIPEAMIKILKTRQFIYCLI